MRSFTHTLGILATVTAFSLTATPASAQIPSIPKIPSIGELQSLESVLPLLNFIKLGSDDTKKLINAIVLYRKYGEPTLKVFKAAQSGDLLDLVLKSPEIRGKLGYPDLRQVLAKVIEDKIQQQSTNPTLPGLYSQPDIAQLSYQQAISNTVFGSGSAFFSLDGQKALEEFSQANQRLSNDTNVLAVKCANEIVSQDILKCGNQIAASQVEAQTRNSEIQRAIAYGTAATNLGVGKLLEEKYNDNTKKIQEREENRASLFQDSRLTRSITQPPIDRRNGNASTFPYPN